MLRTPLLATLIAAALAVAGCGSGDDAKTDGAGTTTAPTTSTATTTAAPPDDASTAPAIANAEDLEHKPEIARPTGPTPSALVVKDLVVGKGPAAASGDTVTLQYVGVSFSNGKEFDTTWGKDQPITFQLGQGEVIPGWDQGIAGMKVGGRRELVIPPDLAYGADGRPGILPNETLVFVVDLEQIS